MNRQLDAIRVYAGHLRDARDQTSKIDEEADQSSMAIAAALADLYEAKEWVADLEPPTRSTHRGRPVLPDSRSRFSQWIERETGLGGQYTYRLLDADQLRSNYFARGEVIPTRERPLRLLRTRLERKGLGSLIPEVWNDAVERCGGAEPGSREVAAAIRDHLAAVPARERRVAAKTSEVERLAARARADVEALIRLGALDTARRVLLTLAGELNEAIAAHG